MGPAAAGFDAVSLVYLRSAEKSASLALVALAPQAAFEAELSPTSAHLVTEVAVEAAIVDAATVGISAVEGSIVEASTVKSSPAEAAGVAAAVEGTEENQKLTPCRCRHPAVRSSYGQGFCIGASSPLNL
ncbi:hypothetical protein U1Q18_051436 [Sarracenia purpurea var. burkii]